MILKNKNDIYIYFETIYQTEPQKVLDIGMFLKRIGSVSRKVMGREVPKEVWLDGIDLFPETKFSVWKTIYDRIMDMEEFLLKDPKERYDLTVLLGAKEIAGKESFCQLIRSLPECTRYVLTDLSVDLWSGAWSNVKAADLTIEQDVYFLLDFGAHLHGYENICDDTQRNE